MRRSALGPISLAYRAIASVAIVLTLVFVPIALLGDRLVLLLVPGLAWFALLDYPILRWVIERAEARQQRPGAEDGRPAS